MTRGYSLIQRVSKADMSVPPTCLQDFIAHKQMAELWEGVVSNQEPIVKQLQGDREQFQKDWAGVG